MASDALYKMTTRAIQIRLAQSDVDALDKVARGVAEATGGAPSRARAIAFLVRGVEGESFLRAEGGGAPGGIGHPRRPRPSG